MQLVLPYDIINNTPADAVQVETNYNVIAEFVNSQVINRDGTVSMDAPLLLKGDPTAANHAANKSYIDAILPVGIIMPFGGVAAPAGSWLLCDGSSKSSATYKTLFDVLGYRYGGSGGNFNVPNLNGRVPVGVDATRTEFNATGKSGGSFTVPVPQHSHAMPHTHPIIHDHPAFTSGNNNADHAHSIAHDHGVAATTLNGLHYHDMEIRINSSAGTVARPLASTTSGTTTSLGAGVMSSAGDHTHNVDLPNFTGNSGGVTAPHAHSINVPSFTGNSGAESTPNTSNAGVAGVEHIPPYVIVTYIIRAA